MPDSERENPDYNEDAARNRDAMYRLITGSSPDDLREQVRALGGPKAVAPLVGRSRRTVERWVTRAGRQRIKAPQPTARQALQGAFDQARSTEAGRQQIAEGRRQTLMRHHGARMKGTGTGGPLSPSRRKDYQRERVFNHRVDAGTMDLTFDAWVRGGDEGAFFAFNQSWGDQYGRGHFDEWMFSDMRGLRFDPHMTE